MLDYIPEGTYFDFPDLVQALLAAGERVGAYLYDGLWFDIGRQEDYERATSAWPVDDYPNGNGSSGSANENGVALGELRAHPTKNEKEAG